MKKQKGFTLIELLVVIAIIGLLSTLAVITLNNARMKARDAKRVSDIKQVQTALELYFNDVGAYPTAVTSGGNIASGGVTYMGSVPTNPSPQADGTLCAGVGNYVYTSESPFSIYSITYCLGGKTGDLLAGPHTATPSGL